MLQLIPEVESVDREPSVKRFRMQGDDGQSFILTVAGQ